MKETVARETEIPNLKTCWNLLERVAESPHISRSTRLHSFLIYVGQRSLREGCEQVREQEIGVHVFDRADGYDTNVDNIVRVNAAELRKRIDTYFAGEGIHEPLIMEIPRGGYVPIFHHRKAEAQPVALPMQQPGLTIDAQAPPVSAPIVAADRRRPFIVWTVGAVLIFALLSACAFLLVQNRQLHRLAFPWRDQPSTAALWSGFLDGRRTTDIVLSDSSFALVESLDKQFFSFNDYLTRRYVSEDPKLSPDIQTIQHLILGKSLGNWCEYRVAEHILALSPGGQNLHLYNSRDYAPALMKQDNVILIGSRIANPWEELFEDRLNFVVQSDSRATLPTILINRTHVTGEPSSFSTTPTVGYATVAYLPNSERNGNILLIQGTGSEATEAAGEFILSEDSLSSLRKLQPGPGFPYFEVVLRASMVSGTPITATIVAHRFYSSINVR
jgi:hypothetical protein